MRKVKQTGLLDVELRFWVKVEVTDHCWIWTASTSKGYGRFAGTGDGGVQQAHRWLWEYVYGPLDPALHLDHLCRNRLCVRLDHLEPVSPGENLRRGIGPNSRIYNTHCVNGHEFTPQNTYVRNNNTRACKNCHRIREAEKRAHVRS